MASPRMKPYAKGAAAISHLFGQVKPRRLEEKCGHGAHPQVGADAVDRLKQLSVG